MVGLGKQPQGGGTRGETMRHAIYRLATGEIIQTHTSNKATPPGNPFPEEAAVVAVDEDVDHDTHYIDLATSTAIPRPAMPISVDRLDVTGDGLDEILLSGIPEGALIRLQEDAVIAEADGEFVGTVELPGRYMLRVTLFPYQDWMELFDAG